MSSNYTLNGVPNGPGSAEDFRSSDIGRQVRASTFNLDPNHGLGTTSTRSSCTSYRYNLLVKHISTISLEDADLLSVVALKLGIPNVVSSESSSWSGDCAPFRLQDHERNHGPTKPVFMFVFLQIYLLMKMLRIHGKTKYALNSKGTPNGPNTQNSLISRRCTRLDVLAVAAQQGGVTPYHSVQLFYASIGAIIPESTAIAGYLDVTYHDTPRLPPWCTSPTRSIHTCFWSPCQDFDIAHPCCLHHLESRRSTSSRGEVLGDGDRRGESASRAYRGAMCMVQA
ncbi:hypothetical protein EV421DRAFT_570798 [Armillaria borealis]|uniref:Uncharacterized protein n=1 Tax=Armillaria borealis TaxID=47425 RepID=A0AA39JHQ3_9AGAR|nr:hypothetical protein EV421DRAFT_570798 [Armillaria borealis]